MEKIEQSNGTYKVPDNKMDEFKKRFYDRCYDRDWCLFNNIDYSKLNLKKIADLVYNEMFTLNRK